jgi:hypothetical protein
VKTDPRPVKNRASGDVGRRIFHHIEDARDSDAASRVFADTVLGADSPRDTPTPRFMDGQSLSRAANYRLDNLASKTLTFWSVVCPDAMSRRDGESRIFEEP